MPPLALHQHPETSDLWFQLAWFVLPGQDKSECSHRGHLLVHLPQCHSGQISVVIVGTMADTMASTQYDGWDDGRQTI
jgi:hypothetical protein